MKKISVEQFEELLLSGSPLIDVRAPVEFSEGHIPGAVNLPIISDEERHQIGTVYKQRGKEAAVSLGHELVSGDIKQSRIRAWLEFLEQNKNAVVYCFRGGLRSQTTVQWLADAGFDVPLVVGGYKALRQFLISRTNELCEKLEFEVVSGPTGSGKTEYLRRSRRPVLDLEDLAKHRGSAFGAMEENQPTQVDFENRLAVELLRLQHTNIPILIENESRMIGKCAVPDSLYFKMKGSPRLILHIETAQRVENILQDYLVHSRLTSQGDFSRFDDFRNAVKAISKKLGGLRSQEILADIDEAERTYRLSGDLSPNRIWIEKLLHWYYDPLYKHATDKWWSKQS